MRCMNYQHVSRKPATQQWPLYHRGTASCGFSNATHESESAAVFQSLELERENFVSTRMTQGCRWDRNNGCSIDHHCRLGNAA